MWEFTIITSYSLFLLRYSGLDGDPVISLTRSKENLGDIFLYALSQIKEKYFNDIAFLTTLNRNDEKLMETIWTIDNIEIIAPLKKSSCRDILILNNSLIIDESTAPVFYKNNSSRVFKNLIKNILIIEFLKGDATSISVLESGLLNIKLKYLFGSFNYFLPLNTKLTNRLLVHVISFKIKYKLNSRSQLSKKERTNRTIKKREADEDTFEQFKGHGQRGKRINSTRNDVVNKVLIDLNQRSVPTSSARSSKLEAQRSAHDEISSGPSGSKLRPDKNKHFIRSTPSNLKFNSRSFFVGPDRLEQLIIHRENKFRKKEERYRFKKKNGTDSSNETNVGPKKDGRTRKHHRKKWKQNKSGPHSTEQNHSIKKQLGSNETLPVEIQISTAMLFDRYTPIIKSRTTRKANKVSSEKSHGNNFKILVPNNLNADSKYRFNELGEDPFFNTSHKKENNRGQYNNSVNIGRDKLSNGKSKVNNRNNSNTDKINLDFKIKGNILTKTEKGTIESRSMGADLVHQILDRRPEFQNDNWLKVIKNLSKKLNLPAYEVNINANHPSPVTNPKRFKWRIDQGMNRKSHQSKFGQEIYKIDSAVENIDLTRYNIYGETTKTLNLTTNYLPCASDSTPRYTPLFLKLDPVEIKMIGIMKSRSTSTSSYSLSKDKAAIDRFAALNTTKTDEFSDSISSYLKIISIPVIASVLSTLVLFGIIYACWKLCCKPFLTKFEVESSCNCHICALIAEYNQRYPSTSHR